MHAEKLACQTDPKPFKSTMTSTVSIRLPAAAEQAGKISRVKASQFTVRMSVKRSGETCLLSSETLILPKLWMLTGRPSLSVYRINISDEFLNT
jgi:hypothetical protein